MRHLIFLLGFSLIAGQAKPATVGRENSDDVCFKQVSCQDEVVASESVSDVIDCFRKCRKNSKCSFYTLNSDTCSMYETCQETVEDADSLTGHVMCTPKKDFRVYLRNSEQSMQYTVTNDEVECPVPILDDNSRSYSGTVENRITLCKEYGSPAECFSFNPTSSVWEKSIELPRGSLYGASLQSLDERRWFILGGKYPFDTFLDTMVEWQEGSEDFSIVHKLDSPLAGACLSRINRTHSFLTGGSDESGLLTRARFVIENEEGFEFVETTPMLDVWSLHGCGTYYREDGRIQIVVAMGTDEMEIFDVELQQWREGPYPGYNHVNTRFTVPYQNTFKVFGNLAHSRDVLTYDGEGGWVIEASVLEESFQSGEAKQVFRDQICP